MKGLIDFRRLADDETDLVLADPRRRGRRDRARARLRRGRRRRARPRRWRSSAKALGFITLSLAASKWLSRPLDRLLDRLPREFFLLAVFAFLVGMAALAERARPVRGDRRADGRRRALRDVGPRGDRGALLQLPRRLRGAVLLRLRALDRRLRARRRRLDARRRGRRRRSSARSAAATSPGVSRRAHARGRA